MANQVKTPMQNYFEKVLYEYLTFEIPPLCFFRVVKGLKKKSNKPLCYNLIILIQFEQFNSIQYFNGNSTVYWRDPVNIKSTSHDKRHLVITQLLKYSYIVYKNGDMYTSLIILID